MKHSFRVLNNFFYKKKIYSWLLYCYREKYLWYLIKSHNLIRVRPKTLTFEMLKVKDISNMSYQIDIISKGGCQLTSIQYDWWGIERYLTANGPIHSPMQYFKYFIDLNSWIIFFNIVWNLMKLESKLDFVTVFYRISIHVKQYFFILHDIV